MNFGFDFVTDIFSERFGFDTLQIGLAYGGALTIGGTVGEVSCFSTPRDYSIFDVYIPLFSSLPAWFLTPSSKLSGRN